eukprot:TRINITY_DN1915_c0_g1_i1.p1 TRINITY_DN1915_c0_g1~~TRINITY_DN1915_c0_g1_i1.p1  ORF type:complete len:235 (+),score=54.76 TRINITY_DN1915_c0_g1_i1:163-867(+)
MAAPSFTVTPLQNVKEQKFSPYVNNGGTTLAVAGPDFCVVAADTRLSDGGYGISSRTVPKVTKLTDKCVIATSGMQGDMITLHKTLKARLVMYEHQNGKPMSTTAIAQLLSNTLYYKRFFPYYTFNVIGGIDDDGVGVAYSYDAVGSFERVKYSSSGTGQQLVQPILDNQLGRKHHHVPTTAAPVNMTVEDSEALVRDVFNSAGERDIYTGDFVDIYTITKDGVKTSKAELKFD